MMATMIRQQALATRRSDLRRARAASNEEGIPIARYYLREARKFVTAAEAINRGEEDTR